MTDPSNFTMFVAGWRNHIPARERPSFNNQLSLLLDAAERESAEQARREEREATLEALNSENLHTADCDANHEYHLANGTPNVCTCSDDAKEIRKKVLELRNRNRGQA